MNDLSGVVSRLERRISIQNARDNLHRFVAVLYVLLPDDQNDDDSGKIVFATEKADLMFGYLPGELATKSINDIIPERFRSVHPKNLLRFSANPNTRPMGAKESKLIALHKSGAEFPVQIELDAFVSESGHRFGVANIARVSEV